MHSGSETCDAPSMEYEGATCSRDPGHDGPHIGYSKLDGSNVQWTRVADDAPDETSLLHQWSQLLPPFDVPLNIRGVDGLRFYGDVVCKLDAVLFDEQGVAALRVRAADELCIIPWSRVDCIAWLAS